MIVHFLIQAAIFGALCRTTSLLNLAIDYTFWSRPINDSFSSSFFFLWRTKTLCLQFLMDLDNVKLNSPSVPQPKCLTRNLILCTIALMRGKRIYSVWIFFTDCSDDNEWRQESGSCYRVDDRYWSLVCTRPGQERRQCDRDRFTKRDYCREDFGRLGKVLTSQQSVSILFTVL